MELKRLIDEVSRDLSPLQRDLLQLLLAWEDADDEAISARHGIDPLVVRRERAALRSRVTRMLGDRPIPGH